ncbi:MAG: N-acetyltransferase [Magnetococcus sp. DMHC-6]
MVIPSSSLAAFFVHPLACCESEEVGAGTKIWAFSHIMSGVRIGQNCNIGDHAFLETGVNIGHRVTVKNQVMIWSGVEIEDDVFLGPGVIFTNDRYPRSPRMVDISQVQKRYQNSQGWLLSTFVRRGASIGAGAILVPGIEIGAYAMIGAGAVVTHSVLPWQRVVGNPARSVGWVCSCGHPLPNDTSAPSCLACGFKYSLIQGRLMLSSE